MFTLNWISSNRQPSVKLAPKGKKKERISEEGVGDLYGLRERTHKTSACVDGQLLQAHIAVRRLPNRLRNNVLGSNLGFGYPEGTRRFKSPVILRSIEWWLRTFGKFSSSTFKI